MHPSTPCCTAKCNCALQNMGALEMKSRTEAGCSSHSLPLWGSFHIGLALGGSLAWPIALAISRVRPSRARLWSVFASLRMRTMADRLDLSAADTRDVSNRSKAAAYSMTSSAMESTPAGIVRPSVLAVLRLITNSNLLDCMTGNSAGLAPLRILPA